MHQFGLAVFGLGELQNQTKHLPNLSAQNRENTFLTTKFQKNKYPHITSIKSSRITVHFELSHT